MIRRSTWQVWVEGLVRVSQPFFALLLGGCKVCGFPERHRLLRCTSLWCRVGWSHLTDTRWSHLTDTGRSHLTRMQGGHTTHTHRAALHCIPERPEHPRTPHERPSSNLGATLMPCWQGAPYHAVPPTTRCHAVPPAMRCNLACHAELCLSPCAVASLVQRCIIGAM